MRGEETGCKDRTKEQRQSEEGTGKDRGGDKITGKA